ncbi:hypothetical protein KCP73_14820 [Salmonella enterica subsp. enterica]|nr:hypothetical protein KCP73_14820 [Salmonella enterica subsp. enterica]
MLFSTSGAGLPLLQLWVDHFNDVAPTTRRCRFTIVLLLRLTQRRRRRVRFCGSFFQGDVAFSESLRRPMRCP